MEGLTAGNIYSRTAHSMYSVMKDEKMKSMLGSLSF